MERDAEQITQQHQFFPSGGGGMQMMQPEAPSSASMNGKRSLLQAAEFLPHKAGGWDSSSWSWDSVRFHAQPAAAAAAASRIGLLQAGGSSAIEQQHLMRLAPDNENGRYGGSKTSGIGFKLDGRLSVTSEQAAAAGGSRGEDDDDDDSLELRRSQTFFGRKEMKMPSDSSPNGVGMSVKAADDSREDDGQLSLKLGSGNLYYRSSEETGSRSNGKRCRSSSPPPPPPPPQQSQFPTCQVDECAADLSKAKEYHRRHKVCEVHSKAAKAQVSHNMQRFCQQCSRFHPLPEFDEGKRSCRRRLAGHNRRRRKVPPDSAVAATAPAGLSGAEDDWPGKRPEILSFLNILSHLQATGGGSTDLAANGTPRDQNLLLLQASKNADLPSTSSMSKDSNHQMLPSWNQLNCALDHHRVHRPPPEANLATGGRPLPPHESSSSIGYNNNNLAIHTCSLLSKLASPSSTEAFSQLLQSTLKGQLSAVGRSSAKGGVSPVSPVAAAEEEEEGGGGGSGGSGLGPLMLASSSTEAAQKKHISAMVCDDARRCGGPAPPRPSSLAMTLQQLVADQSVTANEVINHLSSSATRHDGVPPTSGVLRKLFPPHPPAATESRTATAASETCEKVQCLGPDVTVNSTASGGGEGGRHRSSLGTVVLADDLQNRLLPENASDASHHLIIDLEHPPPPPWQHSGEASQSGSDQQSPGSSSADWEDRNHRISFKLFDKHPAEFPEGLRAQIDEWLAHRPSDLESYIKPGCVVLTVFLSMPKSAWVELKEDLAASVKKLLSICNDNFWCEGRILVQVEHQKVFVVDGDILESEVAEPVRYPYIQAVRPLAIVAGEPNTLVLKGFNFMQPGTRLCCAYRGKFIRQELSGMEQEGRREPDSPMQVDEKDDDDDAEVIEHFAAAAETTGLIIRTTEEARFQLDSVFTSDRDLRKNVVGRCFMEVECGNDGGDWKPVIIADGPVCAEIRTLEDEIAAAASLAGAAAQREGFPSSDVLDCTETARSTVEEDVTCFLHELGWFFQRSCCFQEELKDYSPPFVVVDLIFSRRLKLLLVFSVERNWCAVVRKLLDVFFEAAAANNNDNFEEAAAAFTKLSDVLLPLEEEEVSLLHRAVRRKCRPMVELLLGYVPSSLTAATGGANELLEFGGGGISFRERRRKLQFFKSRWGTIFRPDVNGPAGLTPLHVAANMRDGEELVDALTDDPHQSGLHAWFNKRDNAGETPFKSALTQGNFKLVQLVRRKLATRQEDVQTIAINIRPDLPRERTQPNRESEPARGAAQVSICNLELPTWVATSASSSGEIAESSRPTAATTAAPPAFCKRQVDMRLPRNVGAIRGSMYRPFLLSLVSIATLCVCMCLLFRAAVKLRNGPPFRWEGLQSGPK